MVSILVSSGKNRHVDALPITKLLQRFAAVVLGTSAHTNQPASSRPSTVYCQYTHTSTSLTSTTPQHTRQDVDHRELCNHSNPGVDTIQGRTIPSNLKKASLRVKAKAMKQRARLTGPGDAGPDRDAEKRLLDQDEIQRFPRTREEREARYSRNEL